MDGGGSDDHSALAALRRTHYRTVISTQCAGASATVGPRLLPRGHVGLGKAPPDPSVAFSGAAPALTPPRISALFSTRTFACACYLCHPDRPLFTPSSSSAWTAGS
ncbi:hypothetical protein AcV7_002427 [Taiwanofungus camphoratus]|nr:hypothetical protein AcV7_002427 [Antrodia cinnamomea]